MKTHITAPTGEIFWRYERAPASQCLLLNPGGSLMRGPPTGEFMQEYIAWCPMPKRDKLKEKELGL